MTSEEKKKKNRYNNRDPVLISLIRLMIKLIGLVLLMVFIFTFVFGIFRMNDLTMIPNIEPGDMILYYRLDKSFKVGETIVYNYEGRNRIARIVATAGDTVDIDETGLKVNDARQYEQKIYKETLPFKEGKKFPIKIGDGEILILSDNRDKGLDSRLFGPVKTKDILGKVFTLIRRRKI